MKTLLAGCSLSDWCGFGVPLARAGLPPMAKIGNHDDARCWYNIVKKQCNLDLVNVSYGGYSNEEILNQTCKNLALQDYELVLIQLTNTLRKWFYRTEDPFAFCLAHGQNSQDKMEKNMLDFFRVNFHSELIEIERTLGVLIMIQEHLKCKNIPLIVINGFGFGELVLEIKNDSTAFCQSRMSQEAWSNKGQAYSKELHDLANKIDVDNWVALENNFVNLGTDLADDLSHPGELSNLLYAQLVADKITHKTNQFYQNPSI